MPADPATNWYGTRRHHSADLGPNNLGTGRKGHALCSNEGNPVQVWDQDGVDSNVEVYRTRAVVVADLPECKKCARLLPADAD
jgi:hypothetical protein